MIALLACVQPVLTELPEPEPDPGPQVVLDDQIETAPDFPQVDVFSDLSIHPWSIDLSSNALSSLRNNPREWAPATFVVGEVAYEIGLRIKGTSTAQGIDYKPSLKLAFDHVYEGQRFYGLRRLNLHNMTLDPILSSEVLTWDIFRSAGLPAPRVGYARLSIEGEDRGLFSVVEDIEDDFLKQWFSDSGGNLYENAKNYCDLTAISCFDREEDDEGNDDALYELIESASLSGEAWGSAMQTLWDWERFVGFMAMERTIAHWDSYSFDLSNYRLYHEPTADRWTFIPWSGDLGFGYRPWSYPECGKHGVDPTGYDMGRLASACQEDERCRDDVMDRMLEFADLVEEMGGGQLVLDALDRVRADAATDPEHRSEMDHFEAHGACVASFLDERPEIVREWVAENR